MPNTDLDGLRVMVTRPARQADHLCQLIEDHGGHAYRFPTLVIEPSAQIEQQKATDLLRQLQNGDLLIFISANAVRFARNLLPARADWPAHCQAAVIGQATARAFADTFGYTADLSPQQGSDSEALLALPELQNVSGRRVIIIRGEGGRALLGDSLRQRGAELHYANVYRRALPQVDAGALCDELQNNVDVIIITSVESLQNLVTLLGDLLADWLWSRQLFVIHQRLLESARQMGFKLTPQVAKAASDEAILNALLRWRHQHPARAPIN